MQKKRILAALLSAAMVVTSAAVPVLAEELDEAAPEEVETVESVEEPEMDDAIELAEDPATEVTDLSGEGTAESPFLIKNDADMEFFRHAINEKTDKYYGSESDRKYFRLDNNVNLKATATSGEVTDHRSGALASSGSIGQGYDINAYFFGTFDGNGYTVTLEEEGGTFNKGLFSVNRGTIKNLTTAGTVTGTAGICSNVLQEGTIEGCTNNATINGPDVSNTITAGDYRLGGIVATASVGAKIIKCKNSGIITEHKKSTPTGYKKLVIGGVVGHASEGVTIEECENSGTINLNLKTDSAACGGIVGTIAGGGIVIRKCTNKGEVNGTGAVNGTGGILGSDDTNLANGTDNKGIIEECVNEGTISGIGNVGGVAGFCNKSNNYIDNCKNTGSVTATGDTVGGILGFGSKVSNCRNEGSVSGANNVGGIAGNGNTIVKCYNEGVVQSTSEHADTAGGIVGTTTNESSLVKNYYYKADGSDDDLKGIGVGTAGSDAHHDNPKHVEEITTKPTEEALKELFKDQVLTVNLEKGDTADTVKVYLTGAGGIYRYMSGELVFKVSSSSTDNLPMDYIVDAAGDNIITELDGVTDGDKTLRKFGFNLNGKVDASQTGDRIDLCTIKLLEYGQQYIDVTDGVIQVAVNPGTGTDADEDGRDDGDDNIVSSLKPEDSLLILPAQLSVDNAMPTSGLSFQVLFPNTVERQTLAYTNMKITIDGAMLDNPYVIKMGSATEVYQPEGNRITNFTNAYNSSVTYEGIKYIGYNLASAKTTIKVPTGGMYTITFSGDGYRTYSVDVYVDEAKTITVWNNAMDDEHTVVETADKSVDAKVTFLAGDIVKDNDINLYDLSAVVAYFGRDGMAKDTASINANKEYIQYDLNRDGQIDSKDIAMVLVSWGQ